MYNRILNTASEEMIAQNTTVGIELMNHARQRHFFNHKVKKETNERGIDKTTENANYRINLNLSKALKKRLK